MTLICLVKRLSACGIGCGKFPVSSTLILSHKNARINFFPPTIPRNWLIATKNLSPPEEAKAFRLDAIEEEISTLEKALYRNDQHIGFCHNDLQYGNIMIDEETKSITLIVSFFFSSLSYNA